MITFDPAAVCHLNEAEFLSQLTSLPTDGLATVYWEYSDTLRIYTEAKNPLSHIIARHTPPAKLTKTPTFTKSGLPKALNFGNGYLGIQNYYRYKFNTAHWCSAKEDALLIFDILYTQSVDDYYYSTQKTHQSYYQNTYYSASISYPPPGSFDQGGKLNVNLILDQEYIKRMGVTGRTLLHAATSSVCFKTSNYQILYKLLVELSLYEAHYKPFTPRPKAPPLKLKLEGKGVKRRTLPKEIDAAAEIVFKDILETDDQEKLKKAFREAVRIYHPDMGGTTEDFLQLKAAYDFARDTQKVKRFIALKKFSLLKQQNITTRFK